MLICLPLSGATSPRRSRVADVPAVEKETPRDGGGLSAQQIHDGRGDGAFAGSRLAHQRQRLALGELQGRDVDRRSRGPLGVA